MFYVVMFMVVLSVFLLVADISKEGGPGFMSLVGLMVILSGMIYLI